MLSPALRGLWKSRYRAALFSIGGNERILFYTQPAIKKCEMLHMARALIAAFQDRRERERLRAGLSGLSNRELMDIGTTRDEIDYIASNRSIDPRGVQSNPPMNV